MTPPLRKVSAGFLQPSRDRGRDRPYDQVGAANRGPLHIKINAESGRSELSKLVAILGRPFGELYTAVRT